MAEVAKSSKVALRSVGFLLIVVFFFTGTLLASFFGIIVLINQMDIHGDIAPNIFMIGLIPPSILTFLLYTKVLGRFL